MITENANREAVLRFIELKCALADLAEQYKDLGLPVVAAAMQSAGYEVYACMFLPHRGYEPPPMEVPPPPAQPEGEA